MKKTLILFLLVLGIFVFTSCDSIKTTKLTTTNSTVISNTTTNNTTNNTTTENTTQVTTQTTAEATTTASATTNEQDRYQTIDLYSINDFHGGTYSDTSYIENIGEYLIEAKEQNENTIILTNGDIFQGTAISNYYYGRPIVDVLDVIGLDGFVIGNHEFDWGIDKILNYKDGNPDNGEMNFPILAANIKKIDTDEPLEDTVPYIIKEFNGVRVGVIGLIGDVINSISASRVENIYFADPVETVKEYASYLRNDEACDVIVVYIHNGSEIDYQLAALTGDSYVDAVFNGHTHSPEASSIPRSTGVSLFYAQASNQTNSLFVGITLVYDKVLGKVTQGSAKTYDSYSVNSYYNDDIFNILKDYSTDPVYVNLMSTELTTSENYYSRSALAPWGASVIKDYLGIDVGAVNSGGFRKTMPSGIITYEDMIEIYPFDNYVKTCEMTGTQFKNFYDDLGSADVVFDNSTYYSGGTFYINDEPVDLNKVYTIGAVDYIFDKDYYDFLYGNNITLTTYLMRDLLIEDLEASSPSFNPNHGSYYLDLAFIPYIHEDNYKYLYI